ncbi:MAG TPA: glycosyltransferase [Solirubrobacteraceae bacterium]|nr:glycosyltransferase [Solirubrobacteraceae bacterium]
MSAISRADLHCHSTASDVSKLGVARSLGLPECATPPEEVYALARRRGMDFVTITDHDSIAGVLEIADRPGVFVSEELTTRFAGEPQAVHVLCYGITPDDHEWLQAHAQDVELIAAYLAEREIVSALAHPFFAVAAPLEPRHRRRLAELFGIWEVRNGSRAPELNQPAATYIDTRGGIGIGGSDDHAGVDVARTWSQTPAAATPAEFLAHIRAGRVTTGGDQGSAAKWAHAAVALAIRSLPAAAADARPQPERVLGILERLMDESEARGGDATSELGPADAGALLGAWLGAVAPGMDGHMLLRALQGGGCTHAGLARRARHVHERRLHDAVERTLAAATSGTPGDWIDAALQVFDACVPVIPYLPATAFLARETVRLSARTSGPSRIAVIADGIGEMHGVTRAVQKIRELGVPGFEVEVLGTDAGVDRRLPAVIDAAVPFGEGLRLGVPGLPCVINALVEGGFDLVHVCAPGPAGVTALLAARFLGLPVAGAYHTELAAYAGIRTGDAALGRNVAAAIGAFYAQCRVVLSPSAASDLRLGELGIAAERIARWDRGVDADGFSAPRRARPEDGRIDVLYAGRLTREKGTGLLVETIELARARDPRIQLLLAGAGPEEPAIRARLGDAVCCLGWLEADELAAAYASADAFLFCSQTDTFGQVILEAQASALPVLAVDAGGPAELIEDGRTGLLRPPAAEALADALVALAADPVRRGALGRAARAAVRDRSWDASLARLAAGWSRALGDDGAMTRRAA